MDQTPVAGGPGPDSQAEGGIVMGLPRTVLGKWSMWLAVAFAAGFALNSVLVGFIGTSSDQALGEFSRTYLPYWGIALLGSGLTAGVVGLVAIFKDKERSVVTFLAIAPMLFVLTFLLGEVLVPH